MSDMTKFDIMPLTESDRGVASYLMIYSAYEYLNKLIPKIELGGLAIKNSLIIRKFYKAVLDGKIVGLIYLSDYRSGYIELDYSDIRKQFGIIKAKKVYNALESIFSIKNIPKECGYIGYPISAESMDTSVAEALLKYILSQRKYSKYYMKVSNNEFTNRELLEKLGFKAVKEYEIEESLNQKTTYLLMEYSDN